MGGQSAHFCPQHLELFFHVADEVRNVGAGLGGCRLDCVSAHAVLGISTYPRGTFGPGTAHRLLRTLCSAPGAEVLRAEPAVLAGRAYGSIVHCVGVAGWGRRCPGAVPPCWRLYLLLSHPGRTVPGAVAALGAWILGLPDSCTFGPVVALDFGLLVAACGHGSVNGRQWLLAVFFFSRIPHVHLVSDIGADPVPCLAPLFWWPGHVQGLAAFVVSWIRLEVLVRQNPARWPVRKVQLLVLAAGPSLWGGALGAPAAVRGVPDGSLAGQSSWGLAT